MGSGCTSSSSNPSKGCLEKISSNCVVWQGDANTDLNICSGDTITEVINSLITQINTSFNGTNITVDVDSVCSIINTELVGKQKTLPNILQALINVICALNSDIVSLQSTIEPHTFSVICLTGNSALQSLDVTIGVIIDQVCQLKTQLENVLNTLNNSGDINTTISNTVGNMLLSAITSCGDNGIVKTGSGSNAAIKFTGFVPKQCPIPFIGPLSWFDNNGIGLPQYGMCGWYIMNGLNGTQNWMGYTFAGATVLPGVNSTGLDARVALPNDQSNIGDKKGEVAHILKENEMPKHNHAVNDLGHSHGITAKIVNKTPGGANSIAVVDNFAEPTVSPTTATYSGKIEQANSNILLLTAGNNYPHENRQPTAYGVWIVRL